MNASAQSVSEPTPECIWDVVDAALVINLDHRTDRWDRVREHLKSVVPVDRLHRVSAVLGKNLIGYATSHWFRRTKRSATWAGRAGCTVSHRNAMRVAIDRGWNWVLMIEDDCHFVCGLDGEVGRELATFLRTRGETFGFVYLGFDSPQGPIRRIVEFAKDRHIYQITGASTTHAYLVNQSVMRRLLAEFPESETDIWPWVSRNVVIDRWYSLNLHRWTSVAAVSPQLAIQEPSLSDITQRSGDFSKDGETDVLAPLANSSLIWTLATASKSILRPVREMPRILKSLARRWFGF